MTCKNITSNKYADINLNTTTYWDRPIHYNIDNFAFIALKEWLA